LSKRIRFKKYADPEQLLRRCYGIPKSVKFKELRIHGCDLKGRPVEEFPATEAVSNIRKDGYWGFADSTTRTIHYWASRRAPKKELLGFFAHEIGHLTGQQKKREIEEERRAEEFRAVAEAAFDVVSTGVRSGLITR
jgi:hypothetical protein